MWHGPTSHLGRIPQEGAMDRKTAPVPLLRPDGGAVRILVVDDEPDTDYVVSTVSRYQGRHVRSAVAQAERLRPDAVGTRRAVARPRGPRRGSAHPSAPARGLRSLPDRLRCCAGSRLRVADPLMDETAHESLATAGSLSSLPTSSLCFAPGALPVSSICTSPTCAGGSTQRATYSAGYHQPT